MELGALPRGLTQGGFLQAAAAILCSEAGSGPELGRQVLWKQLWPQVSQAASLLQICPPPESCPQMLPSVQVSLWPGREERAQ